MAIQDLADRAGTPSAPSGCCPAKRRSPGAGAGAAAGIFAILLAFAAPAPAQRSRGPGPWDGDLWLLESDGGIEFGSARQVVRGVGVPTLIADRSGRLVALFQWFPEDREDAFDRVAVSFSEDSAKSWSDPRPIVIDEFPRELLRPCDPTVVELQDGRFRLYFTSATKGARWPSKDPREAVPGIYSAISEDAIRWRFEPGVRLAVEGEPVIDCAAARLGKTWHLYSPVQDVEGRAYHAVSEDGLAFERRPDVSLPVRGSWLGCAVAVEGALRFYGSGGGRGGWSATSRDGEDWELDEGASRELGADPGVARAPDGRWILVGTHQERPRDSREEPEADPGDSRPQPGNEPGGADRAFAKDEDHAYVLEGSTLLKIDQRTLEVVGRLELGPARGPGPGSGGKAMDRTAFYEFFRAFDSARAVRHLARVYEEPRLVGPGRTISIGQGGFPRLVKVAGRFYGFFSDRDAYYAVEFDSGWKKIGRARRITPAGDREVDHAITASGDFIYHYAMHGGGAGRVLKFDAGLALVAATDVFGAGQTDMILDQNIAVLDGKVYAGGEYREGGPWQAAGSGEQNIPPDPKVKRGMHLRVFDLDLAPLEERDLVAEIPGAAIPHQFWGLGASQVLAGDYHSLVVHSPVGNVARFDRGESLGARQIFVLRYDRDFRFVDAKGPLSDTDRDNSWCTGAVYEDGRFYAAYISVSEGCIPGPGEKGSGEVVQNVRLGIFDENFEELETIDVTPTGEGGGWPGLLKDGNRLYVTYAGGGRDGSVIREFVLRDE
ncbi:MAG: exo-alpha-sialidase [Planctomycetes bacterium]|nr:exo-alpha-sialidase [Planctomycetota bacterium]